MKFLPTIALPFLFFLSCENKKNSNYTDTRFVLKTDSLIDVINSEIDDIEKIFDSSIQLARAGENDSIIKQKYNKTIFLSFQTLQDKIAQFNELCYLNKIDSSQYEILFSRIVLDSIQFKSKKLERLGTKFNLKGDFQPK